MALLYLLKCSRTCHRTLSERHGFFFYAEQALHILTRWLTRALYAARFLTDSTRILLSAGRLSFEAAEGFLKTLAYEHQVAFDLTRKAKNWIFDIQDLEVILIQDGPIKEQIVLAQVSILQAELEHLEGRLYSIAANTPSHVVPILSKKSEVVCNSHSWGDVMVDVLFVFFLEGHCSHVNVWIPGKLLILTCKKRTLIRRRSWLLGRGAHNMFTYLKLRELHMTWIISTTRGCWTNAVTMCRQAPSTHCPGSMDGKTRKPSSP